MDVQLPPETLLEVYRHALETHPEECCGAVLDSGVRRFDNVQDALHAADPAAFPRTARTAFRPSDSEQLFLARSLAGMEDGPDPVRVLYHSHHDAAVGAALSAEDLRGLTFEGRPLHPALLLLVVDVRSGGDGGAAVAESRLHGWTGDGFAERARFGPDGAPRTA